MTDDKVKIFQVFSQLKSFENILLYRPFHGGSKIIHVGHKCDYYCLGCIYSLRKIIDRTREGVVLTG
jgi:hypothetical protein